MSTEELRFGVSCSTAIRHDIEDFKPLALADANDVERTLSRSAQISFTVRAGRLSFTILDQAESSIREENRYIRIRVIDLYHRDRAALHRLAGVAGTGHIGWRLDRRRIGRRRIVVRTALAR